MAVASCAQRRSRSLWRVTVGLVLAVVAIAVGARLAGIPVSVGLIGFACGAAGAVLLAGLVKASEKGKKKYLEAELPSPDNPQVPMVPYAAPELAAAVAGRPYEASAAPAGPTDVDLTRPDFVDPERLNRTVILPHQTRLEQVERAPQEPQDTLLYGVEDRNRSLEPYNGQPPPVVVAAGHCPAGTPGTAGLPKVPIDLESAAQHRERAAWVQTEHGVVDKLEGQNVHSEFYRRDLDVKKREFAFTRLYGFDRNGTGPKTGYGNETLKNIHKQTVRMRRDPFFEEPARAHPPPAFGSLAQQA